MLSVILITYNEEPDIEACLESVVWADEIVVVDCGSKDRTVEICTRYTRSIHQVDRHGSGLQKQQALDRATHPWILNIDADERVSPPLRMEIERVLRAEHPYDGYRIPRQNWFLGRHIRHAGWGADCPVRLFRRTQTRVTDTQVHEGFVVDGRVGTLTQPLVHDAYKSLYQYLEKLNEYTSIEVRNRLRARPDRRIRWMHVTLAPLGTFWKMYVVRQGFRDGFQGLLLCLLSSFSVMVGYAKVWEYQMRHREGKGRFPPIRTEEVRTRQPGYNRLIPGGDEEFGWKDR
jgi:glycosyltransferase involved in cell wall biosynthesis